MKYFYRYLVDDLVPGKFTYLPIIVANLGEYKVPIVCLIDTGSSGKESTLRGVGGDTILGYYHEVELLVCGYQYACQAFLTADLYVPYCILGQVGFFQHFRVTFDLPKLSFEVVPVKS